ncbi:MAG: S-adenosylmethionine:tRNA ribosyltransferase-isomerase [Bacteroidetes bacterium]|nr:S-adenosylmethionine:tRNA ribosyltransferase-isomerase [Bacteroidota bacterium]
MDEYSYPLPEERIAKYPLKKRDNSKLLVYKNGEISHDDFGNLVDYLNSGSLLVFNDTKVIQARLEFRKDTGARIEIFCLEPKTPADYMLTFQATGSVTWRCIVGNLSKWKGQTLCRTITTERSEFNLFAERIGEEEGEQIVKFSWNNIEISFGEILETTGLTPIPPYLNRNSEEIDKRRYQTIYSKWKGSVAAPTAGFHFTDEVLKDLDRKKITRAQVTLHIGTGTFKPVKSHTARGHKMHTERFFIRKPDLLRLAENKQIIPVGTTSLRTLESLYWLARKIKQNPEINPDNLTINQWEPYQQDVSLSRNEIVETLLEFMDKNGKTKIEASTEIMIIPGYKFRMTDGLITNYHQPHSTLLLLIAAFVGEDWKKIYQYSLENNFRFLSYGDSSLLLPD